MNDLLTFSEGAYPTAKRNVVSKDDTNIQYKDINNNKSHDLPLPVTEALSDWSFADHIHYSVNVNPLLRALPCPFLH